MESNATCGEDVPDAHLCRPGGGDLQVTYGSFNVPVGTLLFRSDFWGSVQPTSGFQMTGILCVLGGGA